MPQSIKSVLIADDVPGLVEELALQFARRSDNPDYPYRFEVDKAFSKEECIAKLHARMSLGEPYDVAVLDLRLQGDDGPDTALEIAESRALAERVPEAARVEIIFTAHAGLDTCVQLMRAGAWDYIEKYNKASKTGGPTAVERVVASAEARLKELDLQRLLQRRVGREWLPRNQADLEQTYAGKLVAIWHEPEIHVIASAADPFELYQLLAAWRMVPGRQSWERPLIVKVSDPVRG